MKRKGRKSTNKKSEADENGAEETGTENGDTFDSSDNEPEPGKKRTSSKRKANEPSDESGEEESAKKRVSRGKAVVAAAAAKTRSDEEDEEEEIEEEEPKSKKSKKKEKETPKKKASKGKAAAAKPDKEEEESEENDNIPKKKTSKGKAAASAKPDSEEEEESDEEDYEVEDIIDEKTVRGVRHFLIRWKGYGKDTDSWEPASTLNCPDLVTAFKARNKGKKKSKFGNKSKKVTPEPTETWDENENFEVDRILEVHFKKDGKREFLVSWRGYSHAQNSWEPEENMDCKDLIKKFMDKVDKAKDADLRELRVSRPQTDRLTLVMYSGAGRRTSKRQNGLQRVHYHDAE